jgi:hypothetical protein
LYTGVSKSSSFEITGSGVNNITVSLDDNTNTYSPSTITMNGNLVLTAGTLTAGANSINIGGNFTNNAIFAAGTSTVSFINATNSDLNGTAATVFYNLSINKTTTSNYISLNNDLTVNNQLSLASGKIMLAAFKLKQSGPIVRTAGFIDGLSGTLDMAGSTAQTIPANSFVNNALANLVINNSNTGVTLGGALDIYNKVSFGDGNNKVLASAGYLTLKSSATNTASVSDITNDGFSSGNAITGDVTVERYIPAGRKWRFLSVSTTGSQTFKQAWMENNSAGANSTPGYGMMISDNNAGTWASNGFDAWSQGGPTVKTYDVASNNWIGISSTTNSISSTMGYMTFVRGSRAYATTNTTTSPTVLRTTGVLKQGSQAAIAVSTNTMVSVGNPYPAAIDLRKLSKTGVQDFFYVWDPKLGGSYGVGGYQTFSKTGSDYYVTPGGGSYGVGAAQNFIDCGQAFFVKGAAGGTLNFHEFAKAAVSHDVFSPQTSNQPESFRANLLIPTADTVLMADGILVDYDDMYSNAVDYNDALKISNGSENVGLRRDGSMLMIERRSAMSNHDTLYLNISGMRVQNYRWIFSGIDIAAAGRAAYLKDNFLGTTTPLNLAGSTTIDFSVTGNAPTYANNRFMIVFEQASVVPVTLTSISAIRNIDKTININWHVENEIAIEKYEVERSADAGNFNMINKALPVVTANGNYQVTDLNPFTADNFYRIKATSLSGLVQYSSIVKVKAKETGAQISVYPSFISDKKLNISFSGVEKAKYAVQVSNIAGQVVLTDMIMLNTNNMIKTIELGSVPAGIYNVIIKNNNAEKSSYKIVVE